MRQKITVTNAPKSAIMRQDAHPLEKNDPVAYRLIELVSLEWLERANAPIPRHQEVPPEAFQKPSGRSVVVALSHGWYYQTHPDPEGNKLDLIQNKFAPQLRQKYPETNILVFFDFLATPQWPRTQKEDKLFKSAMEHMNSIYVYCDVALFLEATLPVVDMRQYEACIKVKLYEFGCFRGAIQVQEVREKTSQCEEKNEVKEDEGGYSTLQVNDIILSINNERIQSLEHFKKHESASVLVRFHKRPYGIPNTIPNNDRGWLLLERVTIAIKTAAARNECFEDIVLSDSEFVRSQIFNMSERLRSAAENSKKKHSNAILALELKYFESVLETKRFSFKSDKNIVKELLKNLITNFSENWEAEERKQQSMSKRVREILLRWGAFSPTYIRKCRFLTKKPWSEDIQNMYKPILCTVFLCPMIFSPLFCFDLSDDPLDENEYWKVSLWCGFTFSLVTSGYSNFLSKNLAGFTQDVPAFLRFMSFFTSWMSLIMISSFYFIGIFLPCQVILVIIGVLLADPILSWKIIPVQHKTEAGMVTRYWNMGSWFHLPSHVRFDAKARFRYRKSLNTALLCLLLCVSYPCMAALFNASALYVQVILVPILFLLRTAYEYLVEFFTSHHFGSDALSVTSFFGVQMHEVCLSVIICNMKSPFVFCALIFCDVCENAYCLWSLSRTSRAAQLRISPSSIEPTNNNEYMYYRERKTLTRKTSSFNSIVSNVDAINNVDTALFISATLLQREFIEVSMPLQAIPILSFLYLSGAKSVSMFYGWSNEEYMAMLMYLLLDVLVESIVFFVTIYILKRIYPRLSVIKIIIGLFRNHKIEFMIITATSWGVVLMMQSTYSAMDMSLKFQWLECADEKNRTWLGGFAWEC